MNKIILSKFNLFGIISTLAVTTLVWIDTNEIIGLLLLTLLFVYLGVSAGKKLLPGKGFILQILFGALISASFYIIILSVIYWFFQVNQIIISSVIVMSGVISLLLNLNRNISFNFFKEIKEEIKNFSSKKILLYFSILIGYFCIFWILFIHRTGDTIISPWILLDWKFFGIFLIVNSLLLYFLNSSKQKLLNYFLLLVNFSVFFWVGLIIYKHGFGFDPFIHQATENWIVEKGFITPKKPYYIGQYVLVVMLHFITNISIHFIDSALVPVSAAVFIPACTYLLLEDKNNYLSLAAALLPTLLLSQFISTTPNNFALLFAFILLFWCWFEWGNKNKKYHLIGTTLSFASISIHPFIGLPISIFYFGSLLYRYLDVKKKYSLSLYLIGIVFSLPVVMSLYVFINNTGTIVNPITDYQSFFKLFKNPHWYLFGKASWYWQLIYYFKVYAWKYILILISLYGFYKLKHKKSIFFVSTAFGLFLSTFFLATGLNFSKIISYEETVFAQRILDLALLMLAPGLIIGFIKIISLNKLNKRKIILAIISSFVLLFSLYFTYPTRDPVSQYTGYNVRTVDLQAVEFIDNRNKDKNYIVITNQMIGAAALKKFGFAKYLKLKNGSEHYFYSIPTGGTLYKKFFSKMVYKKPKRRWMKQAMNFAGVDRAYFVHTNYWHPAEEIRDQAKKYADQWWNFKGKVWVFEYKK